MFDSYLTEASRIVLKRDEHKTLRTAALVDRLPADVDGTNRLVCISWSTDEPIPCE